MAPCGGSAPFAFPVPHRGLRACLSWPFVSWVAGRGTARAGGLAGTEPPPLDLRGDRSLGVRGGVETRDRSSPVEIAQPAAAGGGSDSASDRGQLFMRLVSHCTSSLQRSQTSRETRELLNNTGSVPSASRILQVEGISEPRSEQEVKGPRSHLSAG